MKAVDEEEPMEQDDVAKVPGMIDPQTIARSDKKLSKFSNQFDFDGDGNLDSAELRVKNLYRKAEEDGREVNKEDIFLLVKDEKQAKRDAALFKKITIVFVVMSILLLCGTFGLVFVAVNLSKESKVNSDGQLQATRDSQYPVSTLGSGGVGRVEAADAMYGSDVLVLNGVSLTYVATIPKSTMETIWRQRQNGVQTIIAQVHFINPDIIGEGNHNWEVHGNIDQYFEDDRIVYLHFETSYIPDSEFTVICYRSSDLCAIAQEDFESDQQEPVNQRHQRQLLLGLPQIPHVGQKQTPPGGRRLTVTPELWQEEVSTECWMSHYELSLLFAHEHYLLLLIPTLMGCPNLAVDVEYPTTMGSNIPEKKVTFVSNEVLDQYSDSPRFVFHHNNNDDPISIPLAKFIGAVHQARIASTQKGVNEEVSGLDYDYLTNNCATFILDVLYNVNIIMSNDGVDFITDSLYYNSTVMAEAIEDRSKQSIWNAIIRRIFGSRAIVKQIVQTYVDKHKKEKAIIEQQDDL